MDMEKGGERGDHAEDDEEEQDANETGDAALVCGLGLGDAEGVDEGACEKEQEGHGFLLVCARRRCCAAQIVKSERGVRGVCAISAVIETGCATWSYAGCLLAASGLLRSAMPMAEGSPRWSGAP